MLRYKSNKQAVLIAALIILLCLVSLAGATLAIFTGDPEDGTIGIITTTGDVKVGIIDAETGESLVGKALQFCNNINTDEVIFEPGATFVTEGFKVINRGNIPINYKLHMGENDIVDINGQPVDINEFNANFEIFITKDPNNLNAVSGMTPFIGELDYVDGNNVSDTYHLVIRMKETAGNKFQNQEYSGIGITVYAVQGNVGIQE